MRDEFRIQGYFQELDTVNFNYNQLTKVYAGKLRETNAKIFLYSLFYDIVLSPNQVLDLLILREGLFKYPSDKLGLLLPFRYGLDYRIRQEYFERREANPFQKQLASVLARKGKDAFIFSSIAEGRLLAKQWGDFLLEKNLSEEAILSEIRQHPYAEILEWAKYLDQHKSDLLTVPYRPEHGFQELLDAYKLHSNTTFPLMEDTPSTRSQAYQIIESTASDESAQNKEKDLPDFIANLQYSIGTGSRLILEPTSPYIVEKPLNVQGRPASVTIDFLGLFKAFPMLKEVVANTKLEKISEAIFEAKKHTNLGWENINDIPVARGHFGRGLEVFLTLLLEVESGAHSILGEISPSVSTNNVISSAIPIGKFIRYLMLRRTLKGVGRIINVFPNVT